MALGREYLEHLLSQVEQGIDAFFSEDLAAD